MSKSHRLLVAAGLLLTTTSWIKAQDPIPVGYPTYQAWGPAPIFYQPPMPQYPPQYGYPPQQQVYSQPPQGYPQPSMQLMSNVHGGQPQYGPPQGYAPPGYPPQGAPPAAQPVPQSSGPATCAGCSSGHCNLLNGSHLASIKGWFANLHPFANGHGHNGPRGPVVIDSLPTHPYARSPRDFFMFYDNLEAERSRDLRPTLIP
jgi:hypothetical protein